METNNTWNNFRSQLKGIKGNLKSFRGSYPVRKIPLYEVHHHPFYVDYAYKIYNKHTRANVKEWKLSMVHSPRGYHGHAEYYYKDSFQLNDIITSASMMKCNHHYFKYNYLAQQLSLIHI
mgnify:FL=1